MKAMDFFQWIENEYMNWSDNGKKSETQFAQWLGISQATFNAWKRKARGAPRAMALIEKLADKLGPGVYDSLGMSRPPMEEIPFSSLPTDIRERFAAASREIKDRSAKLYNAGPDSPEVKALAAEVFAAHGFNITSIK